MDNAERGPRLFGRRQCGARRIEAALPARITTHLGVRATPGGSTNHPYAPLAFRRRRCGRNVNEAQLLDLVACKVFSLAVPAESASDRRAKNACVRRSGARACVRRALKREATLANSTLPHPWRKVASLEGPPRGRKHGCHNSVRCLMLTRTLPRVIVPRRMRQELSTPSSVGPESHPVNGRSRGERLGQGGASLLFGRSVGSSVVAAASRHWAGPYTAQLINLFVAAGRLRPAAVSRGILPGGQSAPSHPTHALARAREAAQRRPSEALRIAGCGAGKIRGRRKQAPTPRVPPRPTHPPPDVHRTPPAARPQSARGAERAPSRSAAPGLHYRREAAEMGGGAGVKCQDFNLTNNLKKLRSYDKGSSIRIEYVLYNRCSRGNIHIKGKKVTATPGNSFSGLKILSQFAVDLSPFAGGVLPRCRQAFPQGQDEITLRPLTSIHAHAQIGDRVQRAPSNHGPHITREGDEHARSTRTFKTEAWSPHGHVARTRLPPRQGVSLGEGSEVDDCIHRKGRRKQASNGAERFVQLAGRFPAAAAAVIFQRRSCTGGLPNCSRRRGGRTPHPPARWEQYMADTGRQPVWRLKRNIKRNADPLSDLAPVLTASPPGKEDPEVQWPAGTVQRDLYCSLSALPLLLLSRTLDPMIIDQEGVARRDEVNPSTIFSAHHKRGTAETAPKAPPHTSKHTAILYSESPDSDSPVEVISFYLNFIPVAPAESQHHISHF
ncbi:hypothetical protein HPB51_023568 [Rhipicephalus microplus]|uniref:Uncharacterized protein n=1 Tax=Rhipicephalus microplus TaxID=6941 RepID=A0A9J6DDJ8_RHIMP|nr:hypothetical protein HPB51_023568 [Rhipicephalus microplus]